MSGPLRVLDARGTAYRLRVGGHNTWSREDIGPDKPLDCLIVHATPFPTPEGTALRLRFKGHPAFVYAESPSGLPADLRGYLERGAHLRFAVRVLQQPSAPLHLACHDDFPAQPGVDLTARLRAAGPTDWTTVSVPLAELAAVGTDLRHVDVPFMLYTDGTAELEIADVAWQSV